MSTRAQLVSHSVEEALRQRVPAPFRPAQRVVERQAFGLGALDEALDGGVPVGAITELMGPACSGRVTAALSLLANLTAAEGVCAWVDVADALDPESAAAHGVALERLLWVRCGAAGKQRREQRAGAAMSPVASSDATPAPAGMLGRGSPHPRSEGRHMPEAIVAMLGAHGSLLGHKLRRESRVVGTPGAPNRPLMGAAADREEQVPTDRQPSRRGEQLLATHAGRPRRVHTGMKQSASPSPLSSQALDQALRAADLLLANGGFSALVLDLGSIPVEWAWRIPLATWFRFRAACERSRTILLLLTSHGCARSSAELVVRLEPGVMDAEGQVMTGVRYRAQAERSRFTQSFRKPSAGRSASWKSEAVWA